MSNISAPRAGALPPPPLDVLRHALGDDSITIEWLAGDGSDRCYYRIKSKRTGSTCVLMQLSGTDAEALQQDGYDWVKIGRMLSEKGVSVPKVLKALPQQAALIIQDYGDRTVETEVFELLDKHNLADAKKLYEELISLVVKMLHISPDPSQVWTKRSFDAEKLRWELDFFVKHYAIPVAGIHFSENQVQKYNSDRDEMSAWLASKSNYFVHRDFHSRNVMYSQGNLAIIDFQDGRLGPPSYDLVSLLFDSYVPFDQNIRVEMMEHAIKIAQRELGSGVAQEIEETWHAMLLQRQLKAIGSFGFLTRVKNRGNYLRYVASAIATIPESLVYDKRWPFMSRELLTLVADHIT